MAEDRDPLTVTRRSFVAVAAAALGGAAYAGAQVPPPPPAPAGPITLPPLPWGESELAPNLSQETISLHYGKHHKAYVDNANRMLANAPDLAKLPLEEIVKATAGQADKKGLFNNAAQVWNHTFYWKSLHPKGGGQPTGKLLDDGPVGLRRLREVQGGAGQGRGDAVRQRLGLGGGRRRQAEGGADPERREPALEPGQEAALDDRRLGARLLRGLPGTAARTT